MAPESRKSIWKATVKNDEQLDLECLSLSLPWGNFKQKVQKEAENRKLLESEFYVFFYYIVYLTQANKPT